MNKTPKIGDKVIVTDGSSDGHTGVIIRINNKNSVRIKRDADGVQVDVSFYKSSNNFKREKDD